MHLVKDMPCAAVVNIAKQLVTLCWGAPLQITNLIFEESTLKRALSDVAISGAIACFYDKRLYVSLLEQVTSGFPRHWTYP